VLRESFPDAMGEAEFVQAVQRALRPHGYTGKNTLACIATCRDEISQSLFEHAGQAWGHAFNLAGLAGMIFAGRTGFGAALSHAPMEHGRERYLFIAGPHVGIGPNGEPGVCEREGRQKPSSACGALLALLGELTGSGLGRVDDREDPEQSLIRRLLGERASVTGVSDIFGLTNLAHDVILEDLERLLADTIDRSKTDYAVATGIQIHGPGMKNYIQPRAIYATVDGVRRSVSLSDFSG
jgi:hypothetical protein